MHTRANALSRQDSASPLRNRDNTGDKLRSSIACAGLVCFIPLFDSSLAIYRYGRIRDSNASYA